MDSPPLPPHPVALQGFSAFERSALATYLRVPSGRVPAYEQIDTLDAAEFIIADADHPGVMEHVLAANRVADTVFVGAQSPDGALAWMMRPIDPVHVFHQLDAVCAMRSTTAVVRTRPDVVPAAAAARAATPAAAPRPAGAPVRSAQTGGPQAATVEGKPARRASDLDSAAPAMSPGSFEILLVDPGDLAWRPLERQLQVLGLRCTRAATGEAALGLLAQRPFGVVFIDMALGEGSEPDSLALCQRIKRHHRNPGSRAPVVVLLSAHSGAVERVRGTLAGCDAYLVKPLDEAELQHTLMRFGALLPRASRSQRPRLR